MECMEAWMDPSAKVYKRTETTEMATTDLVKLIASPTPIHKLPWNQRAQFCQRNERCPCGSGKKFKVCHGGSR